MNIITTLPRYSGGDVNAALIREIKTGFQLEKATEEFRVKAAAREAQQYRGARKGGMTKMGLRHVAEIPAREYFRLVGKYGHQEVKSKEFTRYLQKKFPHLASNKV